MADRAITSNMTKIKTESSEYIKDQRRGYSLYVMRHRAIPASTDGLSAAARRVLWMARDGKKYKSAALAGITMAIHPHQAPEGVIDTLAGPYVNNIPLLKGDGAFGTLLNPTAYGASRYTAVTVSQFTKDCVFADIDIIPMTENYDGSQMEPLHFLPLVPMALIKPAEGIAVGFKSTILPRALDDVIIAMITYLKTGTCTSPMPKYTPTDSYAIDCVETPNGYSFVFKGEVEQKTATTATITKLPYGLTHEKAIETLENLLESEVLLDYTDRSKKTINIDLKFKRGFLSNATEEQLYKSLGLFSKVTETLTVLDYSGEGVLTPSPAEIISTFCDWRLAWYVQRYERLKQLLLKEYQRYLDVKTAIDKKVNEAARTIQTRKELKDHITSLGIVNVDYIADLPTYRFTQEEYEKNNKYIADALAQLAAYDELLSSDRKRKQVYINELQTLLTKYSKGEYDTLK